MNENTLNEIILKQISGTATAGEMAFLNSWLKEDGGNNKIYDTLYNIHQISSVKESSFVTDKEQAWQNIMDTITIPKNKSRIIYAFLKYAAAAAVFLLVGIAINSLWNNRKSNQMAQQFSTFIVPTGQKSEIVLPDGSKVWLNSGTTFKYSGNFNKDNREVVLNGEAFFEVAKNKSIKFTINTGNSSVEVYGTAFNVKNYSADNLLEVSVKEGKVGFFADGQKVSDLTLGDQFLFNKVAKKAKLSKANMDVVTAWKNNQLVFKATPVSEVVEYLERWYGVSIILENNKLKDRKYTFKLKTESLTELLKLINIMTPINYTISGKDVKIRYR